MIDIVKTEIENDTSFHKIATINSSFLNPFLGILIENPHSYLKKLFNYFPNSYTIKFLSAIEEDSFDNIENANIPTERIKIYKALNFQKKGNYELAAEIWEELINKEYLANFQIEKILINLFYCKAELNQFNYCIKLYVDYYFINKYLVLRLNVNIVKEQIKKNKYKNIDYSVVLPIFFYLIQADDYDIHTAYECFLLSSNVETPSQLISQINAEECDDKTLFFLKNICTIEIFKHSPFITSTNNKLNERIAICQFLKDADAQNKKQFIEEESLLSKRLIIQKGLQEIDDSKIYVNQASIIQNELKDLKSIFNRYISIKQLSNEKEVAFINWGSEKIFNALLQDEDNEDIEFSKDPQYDIFKEMFYEVRDKFLYSKYGLKLYLSARIRHGVLLGELRPEFELLHLVTEKEKASDIYKINNEWKHIDSFCDKHTYTAFNKYLSDFSRQIDQIINDELLDKYLLIKTEKENPEGWLDYEFDEVDLQIKYIVFKSITTYDEFINKIFDELWRRTEMNLENIQYKIKEDFRNMFFDAIQSLEVNLHGLGIESIITDLYSNLTDVKIKIENKLSKIARWFTITDTQISDSEFTKIIEVCYESMHNHYTAKELILHKEIDCISLIKGQFYTHFVDLFRIFFQNILDYTNEVSVEANLYINRTDNFVSIKIENELKEDEDIELLKEKIKINDDLRRSQLDKQSGLYKALNIIKTNFENERNQLNLDIIDGKFCVEVILHCENLFV